MPSLGPLFLPTVDDGYAHIPGNVADGEHPEVVDEEWK